METPLSSEQEGALQLRFEDTSQEVYTFVKELLEAQAATSREDKYVFWVEVSFSNGTLEIKYEPNPDQPRDVEAAIRDLVAASGRCIAELEVRNHLAVVDNPPENC